MGWVDGGAGGEGWDHWLVGRALVAVGDYYDAAAGYWAGVRDGAGGGGEDWLARSAGQVDASVAGEPGLGGWGVGVDDPGARIEGPDSIRRWWGERALDRWGHGCRQRYQEWWGEGRQKGQGEKGQQGCQRERAHAGKVQVRGRNPRGESGVVDSVGAGSTRGGLLA
ncbi:hypothetical protein GCM10009741_79650 [Kribbella lupini]|uniref:Uncharacterized protein n=1 Tax=Kribbella lupini TaxID=291602 RepID=A0ABN2CPZ2_9ACTN